MRQHRVLDKYLLLVFVFVAGGAISPLLPLADFEQFFYPALVELGHGRNPYTVEGVFTPPWGLLPLAPLGWISYPRAKTLFVGYMSVVLVIVPILLRFRWWMVALYMVSPPVIACLWYGNLDWLALLALVVPPFPFGVLLALIKPQATVGLLLYWCIVEKKAEIVIAWAFLAVIVSFLFFGDWMTSWLFIARSSTSGMNLRLWPLGLLVGIPVTGIAIWKKKRLLALAASPYLSPYALLYSYLGASLALVAALGGEREKEM